MKIKLKNAFTIAEMLIVLFIISVFLTIIISSIHPSNLPMKIAYSRIYHALEDTIYTNAVRGEDNFPKKGIDLCNVFSSMMNVSGGSTTCETKTILNVENPGSTTSFTAEPSIKAVNGVKMWIESSSNDEPFIMLTASGKAIKYYIVYVDLNGENKPNSAVWSENRLADIVAFVVTDDTTIVPIGFQEIDKRYLDAYVVKLMEDESGNMVTSDAMSYYEAKRSIWPASAPDENRIQSLDFQKEIDSKSPFKMVEDVACKNDADSCANNDYQKYFPSVTLPFNDCNSVGCELKIFDYK